MYESLQVLTGGALLTTISVYLPGYATPQRLSVPAVAARCTLFQQGTNISVPVVPNPDGSGVPLEQPITPDADGRLPGYVLQPQLIDLHVSGGALTPRVIVIGFQDDPRVVGAEELIHKGQPNGYAELDAQALLPKIRLPGRASTPVQGAWDGLEVTDATVSLVAPTEVASVQAAWGPWAVGKTICLVGAGVGNATIITTITGISAGGKGVMAVPASTAVTNARAVIGTDDTVAWQDAYGRLSGKGGALALRDGTSIMRYAMRLPANYVVRGSHKGGSRVICADPAAQIAYGPPFVGGLAVPWTYGKSEGFTVDGIFCALQPLFINANNGSFDDMASLWGAGDGVICGGQNCTLTNLSSGGHLGSNCVLDNGCGDYCFDKPEFNFAGKYHLEIRSSQNAEGVGYGLPEYNYFEKGIFEGRNVFAPGGTIGLGCLLITNGRFNMFNDMSFYIQSWDAGAVHKSMVLIRGSYTGAGNPDTGYQKNGDHEFRNCSWTGPGTGYALEDDNVDSGGVARFFFQVFRPYTISGHSVIAALDAFELRASISPPRHFGQVTLA